MIDFPLFVSYKGKYKGKAKKYIDIRGQEARKYWKVREIHV